MKQNNLAKNVRAALNLSKRECGVLFVNSKNPKYSYDQWDKWESGRSSISQTTEKLFKIILALKKAEDDNKPGCVSALGFVIRTLSED